MFDIFNNDAKQVPERELTSEEAAVCQNGCLATTVANIPHFYSKVKVHGCWFNPRAHTKCVLCHCNYTVKTDELLEQAETLRHRQQHNCFTVTTTLTVSTAGLGM